VTIPMPQNYEHIKKRLLKQPATWLVTGVAGFIGSNLLEHLLGLNQTVIGLDNFSTGHEKNLFEVKSLVSEKQWSRFRFIKGDIRDLGAFQAACNGVDFVLHQAAMVSVPRSLAEPVMISDVNIMGTIKLLTAAATAQVRRFVYAGSSSVYGDQLVPVKNEQLLPMPLSPYAAAKLAGEYFCQAYSRSLGLEAVGLRYFNVFGPHQDPTSQYSAVIPLFVTAVIEGRRPTIYGDGLQTRDFTFVENNVRANILAATTDKPVAGRSINIACGTSFSLLDLLRAINTALGKNIDPVFAPARKGDVKHSLADIALARKLLGYEVNVDFGEGIRRTVAWYLSRQTFKR